MRDKGFGYVFQHVIVAVEFVWSKYRLSCRNPVKRTILLGRQSWYGYLFNKLMISFIKEIGLWVLEKKLEFRAENALRFTENAELVTLSLPQMAPHEVSLYLLPLCT